MNLFMDGNLLSEKISRLLRIVYSSSNKASAAKFASAISSVDPQYLSHRGISLSFPDYRVSTNKDILFGERSMITGKISVPLSVKWVFYGVKPMTLIYGNEQELRSYFSWAVNNKLSALFLPFEFDPETDRSLNGYSNTISYYRAAKTGSGAWRGLLISNDLNLMSLGWIALTFGCDHLLGKLLGYPDCCIDAFDKNWQKAYKYTRGDLSMLSLKQSNEVFHPWSLNIFSRYLGFEFIQHFPCKLNCAASIKLAMKFESCLRYYEPDVLKEYMRHLNTTVLVHKKYGVFFLRIQKVIEKHSTFTIWYDNSSITASGSPSLLLHEIQNSGSFRYDLIENKIYFDKASFPGLVSVFTN
jgi:hypothetical protein